MTRESILINDIPLDWSVRKIKYLFDERNESNNPVKTDILISLTHDRGVILHSEKGDIGNKSKDDLTRYKLVHPGDIVINSMNVIIGSSGLSKYYGLVSPVYYMLKTKDPSHDKMFFHYLFRSIIFQKSLIGVGNGILEHRMRIPMDKLGSQFIPLPPSKEQILISQYLKKKTHQIESLIKKTQNKIKLLTEKKLLLIRRYVTKGLNQNEEMKDSGVEWIGEIPKDLKLVSLKFCTKILRGKFTHRPRNDPDFYDGEFPFIQTGDISNSGKYINTYSQTLNEKGYSVSKEFPIDTLVMGISANIGNVSILKIKSCFPDSIVGFYPKDNWDNEFLYYLFTSMKEEFERNSVVSTQLNLNVERIGDIKVPKISIEVQKKIVILLNKEVEQIDSILSKETKKIKLLKEYSQSLISSVVTGKIRITKSML